MNVDLATESKTTGVSVIEIEVDCIQCGNINRAARRACKFCKRTGKMMKTVPVDNRLDNDDFEEVESYDES